jgi:hypothetical protein
LKYIIELLHLLLGSKTTSSTYFELKSSYDNDLLRSDLLMMDMQHYMTLSDSKEIMNIKVKVIDDDSSSIYGERTFDVG